MRQVLCTSAQHALAVDVGHLQVRDLGHPEARVPPHQGRPADDLLGI